MKMKPSELLTIQSIKFYDRQYMGHLERLLATTGGSGKSQGGTHVKELIEKRLAEIYKLIN